MACDDVTCQDYSTCETSYNWDGTSHECVCDHGFTLTAADLCYPASIPDNVFIEFVDLDFDFDAFDPAMS